MKKYACMLLLFERMTRDVRLSSHLCTSSFFHAVVKLLALSTSAHSYAIHLRVYLSQLEVERTDPSLLLAFTFAINSHRNNVISVICT